MSKTLPTIRRKLATVVLACIVPSLIGLGLLIFHFYQAERARLESDAVQTARALTAAVDRDLGIGENVALALATSPSLAIGDLAAFHAQAKALIRDQFPGFTFVLSDKNGQQLLNAIRPFGVPLAPHGNPEQERKVFETGKPVLSDIYVGGIMQQPVVSIDVPVWRDGVVVYDLSVAFLPNRLSRILTEQRLPPDRIISIFDTRGVIVARTRLVDEDEYVGRRGVPALIKSIQAAAEGIVEITTLEGVPVIVAFNRSANTGWTVAIGIPTASVLPELIKSVWLITVGVIVLLGTGFIAAWILGGRLGRSVQALIAPALALGKGKSPLFPQPQFQEAVEVTTALETVEGELNGHRHHLETLVAERTAAMETSNARLARILESAGEGIYGVDSDNRLIFANRAAASLLGWDSPESMIGKLDEHAIRHETANGHSCTPTQCSVRQTLMDGQVRRVQDEFFTRADDKRIPVEYVVTPHTVNNTVVGAVVVFSDISKRRAAEQALRERQEIFEQMFVNSAAIGLLTDPATGQIVDANPTAAAFYGYPLDRLRQMTIYDINTLTAKDVKRRMLLARDGACGYFLMEHRLADGSVRSIETYSGPLHIHDRILLLSNIHDVTARVKDEHILADAHHELEEQGKRLAANRDFVSAILDSVASNIAILDADGAVAEENGSWRQFARTNGLPDDWSAVGINYLEVCRQAQGPERAQALAAAEGIEAVMTGERPEFLLEYTCHSEHHRRWFQMRVTPLKGRQGRVVISHDDISEVKLAEIRLNELFDLNQKIITECPVGIVAYKASGECILVNEAYAQIMGGTIDEVRAVNFLELQAWRETKLLDAALEALASGELRQLSAHHVTPFGREVWAKVFFVPFTSGGEPHLLCIKSDVTEQTMSNEQLAAARDTAEAASQAKSEFVANMSHEIRTPMNAIMGLSRLLEESALGDRERDYVAKIKLSACSLLGILNDILDFSKIEAGRLEIEHAPFTLQQVLRNISAVVATTAGDKGIETIFSVTPDVPSALIGDSLRLQQILLNLTGNAVKFTNRGEVVLAITKVAEDHDTVTLEFSVRDTGIGIAVGKQNGLFAAFSQADSSTSRRYGGTGLGLAISTRLAALMGGTISCTSAPGRGSDFRFTAQFGRATTAPAPATTEDILDLAVLVVDDNETARTVLVDTCRSFHWRTEQAASAEAGLELLRSHSGDGPTFDLLLLDWRMPGTDGAEMLRQATADPTIRLPQMILMVTAFGGRCGDLATADLPIGATLAKPVTPSIIFNAVAALRSGTTVREHEPAPPRLAGRLAGLRVLLVEDNIINQQVARDILFRAGAHIEIASDGQTAVDILATQAGDFDAVLMDVQMPGLDGYEATQIIRTRLNLTTLPIIAMTANAMKTDRLRSLQAGMNAHVAKPIDVEELISTLSAHVESVGGPTATAALALAEPRSPSRQLDLPKRLPGIDLNSVLVRLGGDHRMIVSLLRTFEVSQGRAIAEVRGLLNDPDATEQAATLLHRLRGVAANLGAIDVARLASTAEDTVMTGCHGAAVADALADLEAAMAVVIATARALPPPAEPTTPALSARELQAALVALLATLDANDLKAATDFSALRPGLETILEADTLQSLTSAIDSLDFSSAAKYISSVITRLDGKDAE